MKKNNLWIIPLLACALQSQGIKNQIDNTSISLVSGLGNGGVASYGIVSKSLVYDISPRLEIQTNISLSTPLVGQGMYQGNQGIGANFSLGARYNLTRNTTIVLQYMSQSGSSPVGSYLSGSRIQYLSPWLDR